LTRGLNHQPIGLDSQWSGNQPLVCWGEAALDVLKAPQRDADAA
jgi:hypothetical protein